MCFITTLASDVKHDFYMFIQNINGLNRTGLQAKKKENIYFFVKGSGNIL